MTTEAELTGSAALVIPQVLGILNTAYTGKARVAAFNAYGLALGAAAVFGQLIGGLLIKADLFGWDWRTIFLINVPVGALVLLVTPKVVPESKADDGRTGLDLLGVVLVTAGLVAVVLPLVEGREQGWPAWTWELLVASVPLLGLFWITQRRLAARDRSPLMSPSLCRLGKQVLALGALTVAVGDVALSFTADRLDTTGAVAWCISRNGPWLVPAPTRRRTPTPSCARDRP
ncbi:hypothetical protein ACNFR7_03820 [Streptomyces sp. RM1]